MVTANLDSLLSFYSYPRSGRLLALESFARCEQANYMSFPPPEPTTISLGGIGRQRRSSSVAAILSDTFPITHVASGRRSTRRHRLDGCWFLTMFRVHEYVEDRLHLRYALTRRSQVVGIIFGASLSGSHCGMTRI